MAAPLNTLFSNGLEKLQQGDLRGAEAIFTEAHTAFPGDPVALFLLGMVKMHGNDFAQAEAHFRRALAISPNQPKVCFHLANVLRWQGRPGEAVSFCRITIAAEPHNLDAYLELAKALDESDSFAEAEAAYRHILERRSDPLASLGLGTLLNRIGRSEDAETILRRALETAP